MINLIRRLLSRNKPTLYIVTTYGGIAYNVPETEMLWLSQRPTFRSVEVQRS